MATTTPQAHVSVVITGSTKGIGLGLAQQFARTGHQVMLSGRQQTDIDTAIADTGVVTGKLLGKACNVTDAAQVQALWDEAIAQFGTVDIWINNAGLARTIWPIVDTPQAEVEAMLTTNMLGTINGGRVAAKGMLQQGHGKIFTMLGGGSDGEYFPGMGIYGTTKRGLDYFTNALAKELAASAIIVAKIRPGMIITEGVIREAKENLPSFEKSRKMMNNLVDHVETVAPFLVEQILATQKSGIKIRWLTGGKIARRMLAARFKTRPDQFTRYGL